MLKRTKDAIYESTVLTRLGGVVGGYSSRRWGDMRQPPERKKFLDKLSGQPHNLIMAEQVHRGKVKVVDDRDLSRVVTGVDGLVGSQSRLMLAVHVADCLPLLAIDKQARVIGVAHAGWRGTLVNIAGNLITTMKKIGGNPNRISVSIGPHIGSCCYDVARSRAEKFARTLGGAVVLPRHGRWYLDLALANYGQLVRSGIKPSNIDLGAICTSCRNDEFYSYRRDTKETFGEILGVIAAS